jgi:O-antigen/teichoic acid export membrane protein
MVVLGEKSRALFGGFILGNVAAALVGVRSWLPALRPRFDLRLSTELFRFGWPITIKGSFDQLSVMFDRLFLGLLAGASAVGVYAVAFDFSRQTVFLLIGSTALAGQPLANRLLDLSGIDAARGQLRQNIELMLGVALPAVAGLIVLTGPIANTVLGPSFRGDARFVIGMIAFSTALCGLRTFYFDQAFELARHTRPQALISGMVALVGVGCSLALIPRLGALGAAYSSVASNVFGILLSFLWGRRVFPMPIFGRAYVQSGIATLGMVVVLTLLPWPRGLAGLALLATVGALVYGGLYLAATASSRALGRAFARGSADAG